MIFQKQILFSICFPILGSGALVLVITFIADNMPMECVTDGIYNLFYHIFPNAYDIKIYRHIDRK